MSEVLILTFFYKKRSSFPERIVCSLIFRLSTTHNICFPEFQMTARLISLKNRFMTRKVNLT